MCPLRSSASFALFCMYSVLSTSIKMLSAKARSGDRSKHHRKENNNIEDPKFIRLYKCCYYKLININTPTSNINYHKINFSLWPEVNCVSGGVQQHWILCFEDLILGFFWNVRRVSPSLDPEVEVWGDRRCVLVRQGEPSWDSPDDDGNCNVVLEMLEVYFSAAHILSRKAENLKIK